MGGFTTLYNGLSAGLLRQATYTTTRLGIYTWLFEKFSTDGKPPNFAMKAGLGMTAGGSAAFVGTPAEVALIRMTSDGSLPVDKRRNYSSVFNAIARIYKEEGLTTLWRGATPTMARAMVVNAAQLATYSQAKQAILSSGYIQDGIFCHFVASMISGLVTTIASMPVDIMKTRLQSMKYVDGVPEYKGAGDVLMKVVKNEGFFSLWKGFTPYYFRWAPTPSSPSYSLSRQTLPTNCTCWGSKGEAEACDMLYTAMTHRITDLLTNMNQPEYKHDNRK